MPDPNGIVGFQEWWDSVADSYEVADYKKLRTAWLAAEKQFSQVQQPQADTDVRSILLDVVPGDGSGLEIYAKSVDDVVERLCSLDGQLEDWQLGIKRLPQDAWVSKVMARLAELLDEDQFSEIENLVLAKVAHYSPTPTPACNGNTPVKHAVFTKLPETAVLARGRFHHVPGESGEPDDWEWLESNVGCEDCVDAVIVKASAVIVVKE